MTALLIDSNTCLLIVDAQYGFMPGGGLPVAGGDAIVPVINRIARGSGTQPADVNKLMKQYMQMEKMMGKLAGGGMKGMMRNMKGMLGAMGGKGGLPFR